MFLPAYSPSLAPIELVFGYLKATLKSEWKFDTIELSQKEGTNAIKNSLMKVSSKKVIGCFRQFYKELANNTKQIRYSIFSAGYRLHIIKFLIWLLYFICIFIVWGILH